jgi:putative transposase
MPLAPQEIRTYFITTVTANRRRLFQVEQNATLLIDVLQEQRRKIAFNSTPSSLCPTTPTYY